jgi:hypothetical protein
MGSIRRGVQGELIYKIDNDSVFCTTIDRIRCIQVKRLGNVDARLGDVVADLDGCMRKESRSALTVSKLEIDH